MEGVTQGIRPKKVTISVPNTPQEQKPTKPIETKNGPKEKAASKDKKPKSKFTGVKIIVLYSCAHSYDRYSAFQTFK